MRALGIRRAKVRAFARPHRGSDRRSPVSLASASSVRVLLFRRLASLCSFFPGRAISTHAEDPLLRCLGFAHARYPLLSICARPSNRIPAISWMRSTARIALVLVTLPDHARVESMALFERDRGG